MISPTFSLSPKYQLARLSIVLVAALILIIHANTSTANDTDKLSNSARKSIVFDMKTPKVFYCPQEKQLDSSKVIVKAKPLEKLCEFGGKQKAKNLPSDCYNDIDETDFACDEKKRFMLRLDLTSEFNSMDTMDDVDYSLTKKFNKKKSTLDEKKF